MTDANSQQPLTYGELKKQLDAWGVGDDAEIRYVLDTDTGSVGVRTLQQIRSTRGPDVIVLDRF